MAHVDLNLISGFRSTRNGQIILSNARPGSPIGIHVHTADFEVMSNGFVAAIEGENIWADFLRLTKQPRRLIGTPTTHYQLAAGKKIQPRKLSPGDSVILQETHPQGHSAAYAGTLSRVDDGHLWMGSQCFDFTSPRAKITIAQGPWPPRGQG